MAVKQLCFCLLLLVFSCSGAKEKKCLKSASNCEKCLQSGPECAWCIAPKSNIRCHTPKGLRRSGCHAIYNPQGWLEVAKNESWTEPANAKALFLQPQELSLSLRPGVSQSFPVTITMPTDEPITELNMDTSPVPEGVNITFNSSINGNTLVIQVNVEALHCPTESDDSNQKQNLTGPWSVHITPRGFSLAVKLEIFLECQCDCTSNREESSPHCGGRGTLVCGQCECNEPDTGKQCQTDSMFPTNEDFCRSGPNAPVCSGRGVCVDGFCECWTRVNPAERYSGQYCECSNFDCPRRNSRLCGGHGKCECGVCICDHGWTGEDCSCSMSSAGCMATNQMVCNGKGDCQCGVCVCGAPYAGPTCEDCPFCEGKCERHAGCVECLAFGTGPKKDTCERDCGYLTLRKTHTRPDSLQPEAPLCKMRSHEDHCSFYFTLTRMPSGGETAVVWDNKECPRTS